MTLLDSQLFQRIDSAELLTWVQEQVLDISSFWKCIFQKCNPCSPSITLFIVIATYYGHPQAEEKSLNLTKFTEHFNNMSYWTRTIILQQPDAKVVTRNYHEDSHADHHDDHHDYGNDHDDNHADYDDYFNLRSESDT